jgi:SAM-dependent methyltransferase
MRAEEYERLAAVETRMWWFRGLHRNLVQVWRRAGLPSGSGKSRLLDAGCGTGGLLQRLAQDDPAAIRIGLDRDPLACRFAGKVASVTQGSIDALPFADTAFDAIFSADVLCHRGVDGDAALDELRRCLKPGGLLVLNLPAYQWLYSAHDRAVDNARRYGRCEVARMLESHGFTRIRATYWNTLLFPLMLLRRKLGSAEGASEVTRLPAPLERLFAALTRVESWLIDKGLNLPFGGSILASGVKS